MTGSIRFAFLSFFSIVLVGLGSAAEASSSGGESSSSDSASSLAKSKIVAGVVKDVAAKYSSSSSSGSKGKSGSKTSDTAGMIAAATAGASAAGKVAGGSMFGSSGSLLPAGTSVGGGLSAASAVRTFQNLNKFGLSSGQIKNNQAEQIKKLIALAAAAFRR